MSFNLVDRGVELVGPVVARDRGRDAPRSVDPGIQRVAQLGRQRVVMLCGDQVGAVVERVDGRAGLGRRIGGVPLKAST